MDDDNMFAPIISAFADVRSRLEPRARQLAERIYAGDAAAVAEGEDLLQMWESFITRLGDIEEPTQLEALVGLRELIDAVMIAFGEGDNDTVSPEVWERLRPFRLERRRRQLEHWIAQVDEMETSGTLDDLAVELRREARDNLALIAAGIEPDDD
jgi:hypothetical protein